MSRIVLLVYFAVLALLLFALPSSLSEEVGMEEIAHISQQPDEPISDKREVEHITMVHGVHIAEVVAEESPVAVPAVPSASIEQGEDADANEQKGRKEEDHAVVDTNPVVGTDEPLHNAPDALSHHVEASPPTVVQQDETAAGSPHQVTTFLIKFV